MKKNRKCATVVSDMPFSPLLVISINLNQWITNKVYRYQSKLCWNISEQKFQEEMNPFKYFVWAFCNFILILGIGGPCSLYVLINCLFHAGKYPIFDVFLNCIQLSFSFGIVATAVTLGGNSQGLANFYNRLFKFQAELEAKFPLNQTYRNRNNILTSSNKYVRILLLPSGQLDIIGIASIGIILVYAVTPFVFPFVTLYLCVDSPYFFLKDIFPLEHRTLLQIISIFIFRFFTVFLCVIEACTTFRTMALYAIILLISVSRCLIILITPRIPLTLHSFTPLTRLRLLFFVANETYSVLASVYLLMMFFLLVLCNTLCCVLIPVLNQEWEFFLFGPLIGTLTTIILLVLFSLVVSIDDLSKEVNIQWTNACVTQNSSTRSQNLRLVRRMLRAAKPIAFTYASFGTFKRGTRRDYLYSVILYSVNSILAFRKHFNTSS